MNDVASEIGHAAKRQFAADHAAAAAVWAAMVPGWGLRAAKRQWKRLDRAHRRRRLVRGAKGVG